MKYTTQRNRLAAIETALGRPGTVLRITGGLPPTEPPDATVPVAPGLLPDAAAGTNPQDGEPPPRDGSTGTNPHDWPAATCRFRV